MAKKGKKRGVQKSENLKDKRSVFGKIIVSKFYFDSKNKSI